MLTSKQKTVSRRFMQFALTGLVAFCIDAAVFLFAFHLLDMFTVAARCLGFSAGLMFTWLINRRFAFGDRTISSNLATSWVRYLFCNLTGGVVNVSLSSYLIESLPLFMAFPILAVGLGSLAGLAINFTLTSRFVFAPMASK